MIKTECEGSTKPCRGKDASTKMRSRREALSLDWTMQHKIPRLKGSICAGETGDGLDAARTVASVSPLHVVAHGKLAVHRRLLIHTATPSLSKSTDMTSHLLIIPTRGGYNGVARASQPYAVRLTCPLYHSVFQATQRADGEQGEHCRDGLHPVVPGARKRWPNWLKAGRSWPHSALMGSFSPWPQPCRAVPRNLG